MNSCSCDILYENYLGLIKKENVSFIALLPMAVWIKREFISCLVFQLYFLKKTERLETNSVSQVRVANNQACYGGLIWYHVYHQTENSCVWRIIRNWSTNCIWTLFQARFVWRRITSQICLVDVSERNFIHSQDKSCSRRVLMSRRVEGGLFIDNSIPLLAPPP